MKTHKAPWDYNRPRKICKPTDLNLCTVCGNYVIDTPKGMKCMTCANTEYVKVPEWLVDTVRCGLVMKQWEQAQYLAGLMPSIGGACELNWNGG